jgi:hypothetical protein
MGFGIFSSVDVKGSSFNFSLLLWVLLLHGGNKLNIFFLVLLMFWNLTFDF